MKIRYLFILLAGLFAGMFLSTNARAESRTVKALDNFAKRAELRASTGVVRLLRQPEQGDIEIDEIEMSLGEPHGTGLWHRRARTEVWTSRIRPMLSIAETQGGQWRIPVKRGRLRAVLPGYAERRVIPTQFLESTNIPNVYNILGITGMNTYTYSLGTQWDAFKNRTVEFSFIESKVRGNSTCAASNPNCRPSMRSDIWRVELYPKTPGYYDWNVRFERHDRERFSDIGYHLRVAGERDVYHGLRVGLVLGAFLHGMNPSGEEFSEVADHLVFQYLNGTSTSFNQFYTRSFAFYKITIGYRLAF